MFVSSVMYVIPLAVYSIVLGLEDNAYDNRQYNTLYNRQSDGETIISGESAIALRNLLAGATPAYSAGKQYRNYHKRGDYVTALQDFYSVKPWNVKLVTTKSGSTVLRGHVGDRKLVLYESSPGTGSPMLDVTDLTAKKSKSREQFVDRIMYRKTVYTGQL